MGKLLHSEKAPEGKAFSLQESLKKAQNHLRRLKNILGFIFGKE